MKHDTYSQLVQEHDDLVGLVAYSLYKQQKIDFLERHRTENCSVDVPAHVVDVFCATYRNPMQVQLLRDHASALLSEMAEAVLADAEKPLKDAYQQDLIRQLKEGPRWWQGAIIGAVGNILFAALIALVLFGISAQNKGLGPAIINWLGGEVSQTGPALPAR
ncbi:MAG: hypothetical protein EOP81_02355 [Variovorax sp.]|nr:MAG: hypothetical protein EOP81_02355 [Variovorax sp.]